MRMSILLPVRINTFLLRPAPLSYSSIASSPKIPGGSRPSSSAFSSAIISSRLVAFLIFSCSLCFSLSVSFSRFIFDPPDVAVPLDVAVLNVVDLMPMI